MAIVGNGRVGDATRALKALDDVNHKAKTKLTKWCAAIPFWAPVDKPIERPLTAKEVVVLAEALIKNEFSKEANDIAGKAGATFHELASTRKPESKSSSGSGEATPPSAEHSSSSGFLSRLKFWG